MEPEDVVDVLRNMVQAVEPGGLVLDLQVTRPNAVAVTGGRVVCEVEGERLFRSADAAAAAVDTLVDRGLLVEEAVDDHDVLKHYASGQELIDDFVGKQRSLPAAALPSLRGLRATCAVRERCRLRRLRVRGAADG